MSKTHWKKYTNPDFLGAYAIEPGEDLIATIKSVAREQFTGQAGKKDEGLIVRFVETDVKPLICNATNAKAISKVAGSSYVEDWAGTRIAMYAAEVSAFGETVEALRVRPTAPKEEYCCEECGDLIQAANGKSPKSIAVSTRNKYGMALCADCATRRFEAAQAKEVEADEVE